jgi:hypothetical protein
MTGPAPARKKTSRSVGFTLRGAAIVVGAVAALATIACGTDFYEIPIETPIQPKLDVSAFQRVLVAGFIAGGSEDVDANQETVRLLRSQLRTKSALRVIDADVMPLIDIAQDQNKAANEEPAAANTNGTTSGGSGSGANGSVAPANGDHGSATQVSVQNQTMPLPKAIKDEKDLEPYERLFANTAYWKKIGEEYQNPLIVTGTVLFTPHSRSGMVTREQEMIDAYGRHRVIPVRTYMDRKGFILRPKFVFIDGRTGATMYSESHREEILYNSQQNTPALSSYFELMDRIVPDFLSALSSQKIRGTRVLLK